MEEPNQAARSGDSKKTEQGSAKRKQNYRRRGNQKRPKSNICFQYQRNGVCNRNACPFLHQSSEPKDEEPEETKDETLAKDQANDHGNHKKNPKKSHARQSETQTKNPTNPGSNNNNKNNSGQMKEINSIFDAKGPPPATGNDQDTASQVHLTTQKFSELPISVESRQAMQKVFGYEFMTKVQAETLPVILKGTDVLAKAKTGTGKTLAFLIPSVELLAQKIKKHANDDQIGCLVISPTRELAVQISQEAKNLTKYQREMNVVTVVGGTSKDKDRKALQQNIHILVGTPGRLLDHLGHFEGLTNRLAHLEILILDEADQLLDMGFRPEIESIMKLLEESSGKRQTLLFSATIPKSVNDIASIALRPSYEFVSTVSEEEEQTHLHVRQEVTVTPQDDQIRALASLLYRETSQQPYKIIVFFTTARVTGFMAELFTRMENKTGFGRILEMHSRKSQSFRQKASDLFRKSKNAIMFSSDVSARGMDYPDITCVLQVGLTDRAQYIHRLGRTARAGKNGHGVLLLAPYEEDYMLKKEVTDLPLERIETSPLTSKQEAILDEALGKVSGDSGLKQSGEQAYVAWLGFYNSNLRKCAWDKKTLVKQAYQWAKTSGLKQQPRIQRKTAGKMQLKQVPGLLLE